MRNVFDQYDQPENRLSHALAVCLNEDRRLLTRFLRWMGVEPPRHVRRLHVVEQTLPGDAPESEEQAERRGLPDIVIHDDAVWCVLIESKVRAALTNDQLTRHERTLRRRGFRDIQRVVLTKAGARTPRAIALTWSGLYQWLGTGDARSEWAERLRSYLRAAKATLVKKSGKTVNNILSVLNVLLKTALEWNVIDRRPCAIKVVRTMMAEATFHSFEAFESLAQAARETDATACLIVLLGGEAGLRCGEMMALEWKDVDLSKGRLCVARSEWKGHVTAPKGGRVRHVPLTSRLAEALRGARHSRHARVLIDHDGQPLTQKVVQGIMRRVARRAKVQKGVPCKARPHVPFRNSRDTGTWGTTQRYMHLSPAALEAAIRLLERGEPEAHGASGEAAGTSG